MKNTFFRMLPFVAAAVFAASCGKDGDSDVNISEPEPVATPDPTETTVGNSFVEIPFSIKVNDGKSLSKVALDGATKAIDFETADEWNEEKKTGIQLTVTGKGVSGTLNLVNKDGYKFEGKLSVDDEKEFSNGINLVGTFTLTKVENPMTSSDESFKDLWDNCAHEFKAEFKSTDNALTLVDQNFYIYVATYKSAITIDGKAVTFDGGFTTGAYYVYSIATKVTDGGVDKTIAPSKLYTIGEYVDLGVEVDGKKILFANDNTYYWRVWTDLSVDELKNIPTADEWQALARACHWVWGQKDGDNGMYAFQLQGEDEANIDSPDTDFDDTYNVDGNVPYIFLPVTLSSYDCGVYWSSTKSPIWEDDVYSLCFVDDKVNPYDTNDEGGTYSVRMVRRSN